MAQNRKHITSDNITEWLCSTGFLFPRNEVELKRFEKIYGEVDLGLTGNELDAEAIILGKKYVPKTIALPNDLDKNRVSEYRMAARKGNSLPSHILDKIKKNQNKKNGNEPKP